MCLMRKWNYPVDPTWLSLLSFIEAIRGSSNLVAPMMISTSV